MGGSFRMIAFSGGQRNCPGKRFAMLEATVLLATLLRAAKFSVAEESKDLRPISTGVVQKPQSGQLSLVPLTAWRRRASMAPRLDWRYLFVRFWWAAVCEVLMGRHRRQLVCSAMRLRI